MKTPGARIPKIILNQNTSWFQNHYKTTVIKTVWYWHKSRHLNQRNQIGNPKTNPHIYNQLNFGKGDRKIQWGINGLFNNDARTTGYSHEKE